MTTIFTKLYEKIDTADLDDYTKQEKYSFVRHCQKIGFSSLDGSARSDLYRLYGDLL